MTVFDNPKLGIAQAIKHLLSKSLEKRGLMEPIQRRLVTLGDYRQAHDFARLASEPVRRQLELSASTSAVLADWDKLRTQTSVTRQENAQLMPFAERVYPALRDFNNANQTKLVSPFQLIPTEEVFDGDPEINHAADFLNEHFGNVGTGHHIRRYGENGLPASPHSFTGLGLSVACNANEVPIVNFHVVRNSSVKALQFIDEFLELLNNSFSGWVSFEKSLNRWTQSSASIRGAVAPGGFAANYFQKEHETLRPGLTVIGSGGAEGSMTGIFSGQDFDQLFGRSLFGDNLATQRFCLSCKHVMFSNAKGKQAKGKARRPSSTTGGLKKIGRVVQNQSKQNWWIDYPNEPIDAAVALLESSTWDVSSNVLGKGNRDYLLRLPTENELGDITVSTTEAVLLGRSGPVGGQLLNVDADLPYIFRHSGGPVFLQSTGLRVIRSEDKRVGRAGNSGGPVVVDIDPDGNGSGDNVIIGLRVSGDEGGSSFTGRTDRNAPQATYLPIYMVQFPLESQLAKIEEMAGKSENDGDGDGDGDGDEDNAEASAENKSVEASYKDRAAKAFEAYLRAMEPNDKLSLNKELVNALKREVRRQGGKIVGTMVHRSDDDKTLIVEFRLANHEVNDELHKLEEQYSEETELRLVPGSGFLRASYEH
ncbi:MAG: hypothetical protein AAFQ58_23335 [Pseudomonadota bacterium]